jgi:uncharacterized membrane protein YkoI
MRHLISLPLALVALLVALSPLPALADRDHDQARAALLAGEILPLPAILEGVTKSHPGSVLEVELERKRGRWVYQFKLLRQDGSLLRLAVDARDGSILKQREGSD